MKLIELLLTENVDNLGIVGDVVKVRPGYARNFLLPRGMATKPTTGAIKALAAKRAEVEKEMKLRRAALEAMFEKLKNHELTIMRSANEQGILFGGVSQHDIAQALRDEGHTIEDRMIRIGQQIKRLDTYHVPLVLAQDLRTEIKLWVVSDKPSEHLETGEAEKAQAPAEEPAEKPKKSKKARAEAGEKTEDDAKDAKGAKGEKADKADKPAKEAKSEGDAGEKPKKSKKAKAEGDKAEGDKADAKA